MPIPNNARLFATKLELKLMKTRITGQHTHVYIVITSEQETKLGMGSYFVSLAIALALVQAVVADGSVRMKSELLCSQCKNCDTDKCPPSDAYPHMTAFDNSLIAGALQSDYVRFRNYMDKCSDESYLTVDKHGAVKLRALKKLSSLSDADWKSVNPPKKLNHREYRFWVSRSTGKCLTVFEGKTKKRTLGVADCKFDGANTFQLFAFRFHYHKAFCCCGKYNE